MSSNYAGYIFPIRTSGVAQHLRLEKHLQWWLLLLFLFLRYAVLQWTCMVSWILCKQTDKMRLKLSWAILKFNTYAYYIIFRKFHQQPYGASCIVQTFIAKSAIGIILSWSSILINCSPLVHFTRRQDMEVPHLFHLQWSAVALAGW